MPNFNPRPLGYTTYNRSSAPGPFQTYSLTDCSICWIDLLGVRSLNHQQIISAVTTALNSASEASCTGPIDANGNLIGTPNSAIQFSLVGDALILTEKNRPNTIAASKLAFFYRVNILSRLLHERGFVHRGVITSGEVDCFEFEGSTVITGKGVVNAANLESNLKTAGLFFDNSWTNFMTQRQQQLDAQNFIVPFRLIPNWQNQLYAQGLEGVTFSQFEGWTYWKNAIANGNQLNNKIINASGLIAELKTTFVLP